MKVTYQTCCGVDVHKSFLVATIVKTTGGIANPKWVKAVKGNKDDTKDSKWIGDLFRLGLVKGSYIPCKIVRILREYTRYRYKLVSCRSSEKNRYQNALTVCNVALDSVVSDIFGKSSTSIIDYLLEQSKPQAGFHQLAAYNT